MIPKIRYMLGLLLIVSPLFKSGVSISNAQFGGILSVGPFIEQEGLSVCTQSMMAADWDFNRKLDRVEYNIAIALWTDDGVPALVAQSSLPLQLAFNLNACTLHRFCTFQTQVCCEEGSAQYIPLDFDASDAEKELFHLCAAADPPLRDMTDMFPSSAPSSKPASASSSKPTTSVSLIPSGKPTISPSMIPSSTRSRMPSIARSSFPSPVGSFSPTKITNEPSVVSSSTPSLTSSRTPSTDPTSNPTDTHSSEPSDSPSSNPTDLDSKLPSIEQTDTPTIFPSTQPTLTPTLLPSTQPTIVPTVLSSTQPSIFPTVLSSTQPTIVPSTLPSGSPTNLSSSVPSFDPSNQPSISPTGAPSDIHSIGPSISQMPTSDPSTPPTAVPTSIPSSQPSIMPTSIPTQVLTQTPSQLPSVIPSFMPTTMPSLSSSSQPSFTPTRLPSTSPSESPTNVPTAIPTISFEPTKEGKISITLTYGISTAGFTADDVINRRGNTIADDLIVAMTITILDIIGQSLPTRRLLRSLPLETTTSINDNDQPNDYDLQQVTKYLKQSRKLLTYEPTSPIYHSSIHDDVCDPVRESVSCLIFKTVVVLFLNSSDNHEEVRDLIVDSFNTAMNDGTFLGNLPSAN